MLELIGASGFLQIGNASFVGPIKSTRKVIAKELKPLALNSRNVSVNKEIFNSESEESTDQKSSSHNEKEEIVIIQPQHTCSSLLLN